MPWNAKDKDSLVGTGFYSSQDGVDKDGRSWVGANGYWNQFLGIGTSPNTVVELTTDYKQGDNSYNAGTYTVDKVYYTDPNNKTDIMMTLQDDKGNKFDIPYNFVTVRDENGKVLSHEEYVPLWTNSTMGITDPEHKYDTSDLSTASIQVDNAKPITDTNGNTVFTPNTFSDVEVKDGVEYGYHNRPIDAITGRKVQVDGEYMQVPYRPGETVVIDGKEYTVGDYTGYTGNKHEFNLTLKDADGNVVETTTTEMQTKGAKVLESVVPEGATYGVHPKEATHQAELRAQQTTTKYNIDQTTDQKVGTTWAVTVKTDKGDVDAYATYDKDGKYILIDAKTGQQIKDVKSENVMVKGIADGDGSGIQGGLVGKQTTPATKVPEGAIQSGNDYYVADNSPKNKVGQQYIYTKADGTKVVVTYESNDGAAGYGNRPGLVTGTYKDADGNTYHLSNDQVQGCSKVGPVSEETTSYQYDNNGYRVTGAVVDEGNKDVGRAGGTSQAVDRKDIYDNFMWDHNITQTGTLPGLDSGTPLNYANPKEAIDTLVASQQWTRQDARKYVQDLANEGKITFASKTTGKKEYYPAYQSLHEEIKGGNFSASSAELRGQVQELRTQCDTLLAQMDQWAGAAKDAAMRAIRSVEGKLQVTMGNIEQALEPACYAIDHLDEALEKLKSEDEILKQLLDEQDKAKQAMDAAEKTMNSTPKTKTETTTNADGTTSTKTVDNPAYANAVADYNAKKTAYEEASTKVEEQQLKEDEMEEEILEMIELVQDLQQVIQQYKSFVDPNGSNYHMVSSAENIEKYYKDILYEFENFARLPAITNASDYHVGDIVLFDDGYGYLYKVVEVFDGDGKSTGYVKIIRCDANGNPIPGAQVLTIWDQREITPVKGGRQLWTPPTTLPPPPTTSEEPPPTTTPVPPPPTTTPVPPPPPTTTYIPPTTTYVPPTTTYIPPTTTFIPPTTTFIPPTTLPPIPEPPTTEPTRIPPPPVPTAPPPTVITPPVPFIPHTGIDGVADTGADSGMVKQSGAGALGALAGIMAGAAGLGLTALAKDKDENKEDKEEEKTEEIQKVE